jgi:MoxR-like ATPase
MKVCARPATALYLGLYDKEKVQETTRVPLYRIRVTPDVTEQDVLVKFSDDEEALREASCILGRLLKKAKAKTRTFRQKIEVFREDGTLLLSLPTH